MGVVGKELEALRHIVRKARRKGGALAFRYDIEELGRVGAGLAGRKHVRIGRHRARPDECRNRRRGNVSSGDQGDVRRGDAVGTEEPRKGAGAGLNHPGIAPVDPQIATVDRFAGIVVVGNDRSMVLILRKTPLRSLQVRTIIVFRRHHDLEFLQPEARGEHGVAFPPSSVKGAPERPGQFAALPVFLEDDIDHPADRIGAIDCGGAIRDHLDAIHHSQGDAVQIHEPLLGVAGPVSERRFADTPTVDQHQGGSGPQAPQADSGNAGLPRSRRRNPENKVRGREGRFGSLTELGIQLIRRTSPSGADARVVLRQIVEEIRQGHGSRGVDVLTVVLEHR